MRVLSGRRSAVLVAALATIVVLTATGSAAFAAKAPPGLCPVQVRRRPHRVRRELLPPRNPKSGAYGKYQILPSNWPSWARQYLGNANARQTPANQEKVASGKMSSLYRWLGSWKRVAYWWLTGSSRTTGWSNYAKRYVAKVMRYYREAGGKVPSSKKADRWTASERSKGDRLQRTMARRLARGLRRRPRRLRHEGRRQGNLHVHRPRRSRGTVRRARRVARPTCTSTGQYVKTVNLNRGRSTLGRPCSRRAGRPPATHKPHDRRGRHEGPPDGRDRRLRRHEVVARGAQGGRGRPVRRARQRAARTSISIR